MIISVLSDFHLGIGYNSERENDSFDNLDEAIGLAMDSDLILIAGDVFDSRSPRTSIWAKSISILTKPLLKKSNVNFVSTTKPLREIAKRSLESLPVIAIHGNHDRRMKDEINAVEALDHAGILIRLDEQNIIFEKDGTKVAIHGMSSVAERFAKQKLDEWSPKPVEGCKNILMLHQSIDPYVYTPLELPTLSKESFPKGFDLVVDGHIHGRVLDTINGKPFLIPGSTVITQLEKKEAELEKGIYKIEIQNDDVKINFIPLEKSRKFFYNEIKASSEFSLREQIEKIINEIVFVKNLSKPPIIKFKITGKDTDVVDEELKRIQEKYNGKAMIIFSKELESQEITEKIDFLRNLREKKLSVEEIGLHLLKKNLDELGFKFAFDYENTYGLLSDGAVDKTLAILTGDQKQLIETMVRG